MEAEIPEAWRSTVAQLLRGQSRGTILIRQRARRDWAAMFPGAFDYELRDALADGLENPDLRGQPVFGMAEPGETYEFIFRHEGQAVYAKICLQRPNLLVIIYSSHRPLKGDTL